MKSVSIIIPSYNQWELTHQRMMELHTHIPFQVEIILVDDCSTDENVAGGMGWWKTQKRHRVICIRNSKNLGFGGSLNAGCRRATEDVYIGAILTKGKGFSRRSSQGKWNKLQGASTINVEIEY